MSLSDLVHVASRFQRSIRIDTDLHDSKILEGFVCPRSSAYVLLTMAQHIVDTGHTAFTWTGPYGSGKSSLVVALSALLNGNSTLQNQAVAIVGKNITDTLWKALPLKKKGWRILPVVGQRSVPAEVIGKALITNGFIKKKDVGTWTDDLVISLLIKLAKERSNIYGGLIVFLDEMGKFLEGAAQDGVDIYFFQQLAEIAVRSKGRLLVIGVLHQAFEEYAQRLTRDQRDEWAKVQGRFIDLIVNTAGEEQLDLLARAIQSDYSAKHLTSLCQTVANVVRAGRPSAAIDMAITLERCWPLHPVVACLLGPISRRRFGQNQRSLFGFLNSAEPFGFQDFLHNANEKDIFGPDHLWDYLRVNLEPAIMSSPDSHRWSIAVEAIERCETMGASMVHIQLLKTIALLDLFRERSGLSATYDLLTDSVLGKVSNTEVIDILKQLQSWSLIIYRKHLGAFAIHAGSDFDLDHALKEMLVSFQDVDFRELRALAGLQPILAKRHYHETGALRWFDVDLAPLTDVTTHISIESSSNGAIGRFLLVIPTANESKSMASQICQAVVHTSSENVVIGLSTASWRVIDLAREFIAITKISEERPELSGDPVARREVFAHIADVRSRLEAELQKMFDTANWYRSGVDPVRYSYSELNTLASNIADTMYSQAPKLPNELLNRKKPSSNAVAAQKALLKLMVQHEGEPRLSIRGFPAEGGLLESLLLKTDLYRFLPKRGWQFLTPSKRHDPCGLLPAWKAVTEILKNNSHRTVSLAEIFTIWQQPPYGIKNGLLPILAVAFLLAQRDKLAFYRDGIFQARFTDLDVDYLTNDPSSIQFRWMDLSFLSRKFLSGLAKIVCELDNQNSLVHLEPIDVARGLVGIFENLRPWVKRTSRLSASALQVRSIFKSASDPNKFLFDDIPGIFGEIDAKEPELNIEQVINCVREGLFELIQAYSHMLDRLQQMMLMELQVPNTSPQAYGELRDRAENIIQLTGDFRLNAFIGRLSQFNGSEMDIEGIASLAANKPPRDWVDADLDQAGIEIADLAQRFIRAEAYARVKGRPDKRQAMAVVIGMDGRPTPVTGEFTITDTERVAVDDIVAKVEQALSSTDQHGRNIILAALAEMSARYLNDDIEGQISKMVAKKVG